MESAYRIPSLAALLADAQASRENSARAALNTITATVNNEAHAALTNGFRSKIENETTATGEVKKVKIVTSATGEEKKLNIYNSNPVGKRKPNQKGYNSHKRDTAILLGDNYDKNADGVFACPEGCGYVTPKGKFLVTRHVAEACKSRKARLQREAADGDIFAQIKLVTMNTSRERKERVRSAAKVVAKKTATASGKVTAKKATATAARTSAPMTAAEGLDDHARSALVISDTLVPSAADAKLFEDVHDLITHYSYQTEFRKAMYKSPYEPLTNTTPIDPALVYQN